MTRVQWLIIMTLLFLIPTAVSAEPVRTYQVEAYAPDAAFQRMEFKSYPGPVEGLLSTADTWTGFFRQEGRKITVDLGEISTIDGVSLEFQQKRDWGIILPSYLEASISLDGKRWHYLGRVGHHVPADDVTEQTRRLGLYFPAVEARYLQLHFPVDTWVFARNLLISEVDGEDVQQALPDKPTILAHDPQENREMEHFLKVPGVDHILLIYSGAHGELGRWQQHDFLPLLSYMNEQGTIEDSLFDTFLFLPFPEVETTKLSWQKYLNELFQEGEHLHALNDAALYLRQHYALPVRPKVILTLPYPKPEQEQFYPGISFSAEHVGAEQAIQNRQRAVREYLQTLMSMWREARFEALDLAGIYWYKETMDASIPNEERLVRYAAELVHEEGQKFYWIPYFGSNGYERWSDYGFDYVFLQPNFYATDDPPKERMDNVAQLARELQLGVELEIDDKVSSNRFYHDLFYQQLDKAYELGLNKKASLAYYMGAKSLLHVSKSKIAPVRQIYDDLYRWIKGTYQPRKAE